MRARSFVVKSIYSITNNNMTNSQKRRTSIMYSHASMRVAKFSFHIPVFTSTIVSILLLCFTSLGETKPSAATKAPTILQVSMNETTFPIDDYRVLPRVGKCCPNGEKLAKDGNGKAICEQISKMESHPTSGEDPYKFSPLFSDFNKTGALAPGDERDRFLAIIGDPCHFKRYILSPEESSEDEYYLLLNGSIYAPRLPQAMLSPGIDYCMDVVPDRGVITFVCFFEETQISSAGGDARLTLYACGLLISVPFLVVTIVAYSITPCLMDIHGKALCHYCGCLAVAFVTLAIAQLASSHLPDQMCVSIAFTIQFSFIASFLWLNVMCIETWLQVRRHVADEATDEVDGAIANNGTFLISRGDRVNKKLFFYYSLWAWVPPLLLIIFSMIMDLNPTIPTTYVKPNFGTDSCWFRTDEDAMPYFYVPVGLLVVANIVLFTLTAVAITRHQRELDIRRLARNRDSDRVEQRLFRRVKRVFLVCLFLFFLMGMNWSIEVLSWLAGGDPLTWSAFDLINALQGILIFGIFVLRKPIRGLVWYQIQKMRGNDAIEPDTSSAGRSLLTVLNDSDTLPRQGV